MPSSWATWASIRRPARTSSITSRSGFPACGMRGSADGCCEAIVIGLILRRLASAVPVLILVSLISFVLIWLVPGDAAAELAGPGATTAELARIRTDLGLDQPVWMQ